MFNITSKKNDFCFLKSIKDDDFIETTFPKEAYEKESPNNEIKRNIIEEDHFTKTDYPFEIKPNFSTLESFIEIDFKSSRSYIAFSPDHSRKDLLGFKLVLYQEEFILSDSLVDILSFDNFFHETDISQGIIFRGK